jgi:hypothetical protein
VVIVDGMPGAGKTALVVHAAHRMAADFPDGQLFVTPAGCTPLTERLLRGIGLTDLPPGEAEQAALWRSEIAGRRMLIILDGVRDAARVRPVLPATAGSRTLITTTHGGWHVDGALRVRLQPLDDGEAATLFRAASGDRGVDRGALTAVLRECGGLPAALLDAAARLRTRPQWTLRRLAEELHTNPGRVFAGAVRQSVETALSGLDRAERAAWELLGTAPAEFTAPVDHRDGLEALVDRGLLESTGPDRYRSHPVIRRLAAGRTVPALGGAA